SSVSYSCGAGSTQLNDGEGGSCAVVEDDNTEDGSSGFAPLVITIRVGGVDYIREYNWNDYD
ncbi:MAG: tandem-95 repeat protein, partial [Glaciihabitans sp.]|nr:tandem-95 repeat protein [Glaciihabitans sp.]